jgi:Ni/Co efflux regulator RcnB
MIKTISAALLAVSVLAAPALAAAGKSDEVRTNKATPVKASVLNANAKMGRHHQKHYRHYSHRHHKMAVTKVAPKVGFKAPAHTARHG